MSLKIETLKPEPEPAMDKLARMLPKGGFSVPSAATMFDVFYRTVIYGCPTYYLWRTMPLAIEGYQKCLASRNAIMSQRLVPKDDGAIAQPE
uniref:uncharacterized protein LOC101302446 isoform X2 n=1 Tax=Fragaria vesca subsp. vesca TaxID=101020 RepID=UPI0005C87B4F|nr:PREDICTED: uncharacterized protein LOC101302446 isoform X2 [Fragaria vesca subsp. vesca]